MTLLVTGGAVLLLRESQLRRHRLGQSRQRGLNREMGQETPSVRDQAI
jgi:hypothetical protein